jgi:hypothetical protein
MLDMWSPRNNETRQELAAARATPFDHLEAQEREVARILALAKPQPETCVPTC